MGGGFFFIQLAGTSIAGLQQGSSIKHYVDYIFDVTLVVICHITSLSYVTSTIFLRHNNSNFVSKIS